MNKHQINMVDVKEKNNLLTRIFLDGVNSDINIQKEPIESLSFVRINGISNFWEKEENIIFDSIMEDVISGFANLHTTLAFILIGSRYDVNLYMGINESRKAILTSALLSSYPFMKTEQIEQQQVLSILKNRSRFGGMITGYPTNKTSGDSKSLQIERLCKGMMGSNWAYVVLAKCMSPFQVTIAHERILNEVSEMSKFLKRTESGGTLGKESWETTNLFLQRYVDNLNFLEQKLNSGQTNGMWSTISYYLSDDEMTSHKISNLSAAIYNGSESKPERIRTIPVNDISSLVSPFQIPANELPLSQARIHPAGIWDVTFKTMRKTVQCFNYMYQTIMPTSDLATICQIPRKEMPGFYIDQYVEFDVAERRIMPQKEDEFRIGKILNGTEEVSVFEQIEHDNLVYKIDINDLSRHGLVVGITGGGKSNTSKNLLRTLWNQHKIPFMVVESAKREYWELSNMKGLEDVLIFTLGAEDASSVPYRINPFEKMEGVPLQTHIDYLLSTFKASFDLFAPMPFVLETSIYRIYEDYGWDVLKNKNKWGRNIFPTLDDLYNKITEVLNEYQYNGEVRSNIEAALQARINSLRVGGKGAMLNTDKSFPIEKLLTRPVVMEMEDIGDDDVKAFLMGIILVQLYEYRRTQLSRNKKFTHLILIEEAHRLLTNVPYGGAANPRAKAVEFFTNLLAEIRSYGQGFLIADQVPTKLAPDTLKNTNLKIVHRIVMQEDRYLIGQSMNMTEEQIEFMSSLKRGQAAVYAEGDTRPKLVQMPLVNEDYDKSRKEVIKEIKRKIQSEFDNYGQTYNYGPACVFCTEKCKHHDTMVKVDKVINSSGFKKDKVIETFKSKDARWYDEFLDGLSKEEFSFSAHSKICVLNIFLKYTQLNDIEKRNKIKDFIEYSLEREGVIQK